MAFYWQDIRTFGRALTARRAWNALLVWLSYHLTRRRGKPLVWGRPFAVSVEPTTACNLRCPECPSGLRSFTRPTGNLQGPLYERVLEELSPTLLFLTLYFQGEPYIHPRFLEMVREARARRIYTITSTNGHFLDDERARATVECGLSRLIISVDGTTQDTYEAYRVNGDLDQVLDGARRLVRWKKALRSATPHIVFQFLVVAPNEHQIPEIRRLAREIGVDEVKLKTAQVYDYRHGHPLIPADLRYSRYLPQGDGTWAPRHSLTNHCWKMWHSCVITWDGKVVPCCFDKDAAHPLGDLQQAAFGEIWQGEDYHAFRQTLLRGRSHIDICTNCTEGCKVWA